MPSSTHGHTVHGSDNFKIFVEHQKGSPVCLGQSMEQHRAAQNARRQEDARAAALAILRKPDEGVGRMEVEPESLSVIAKLRCCLMRSSKAFRKDSPVVMQHRPADDSVKAGNAFPFILEEGATEPLSHAELYKRGYVRFPHAPKPKYGPQGGAYTVHGGTAFSQHAIVHRRALTRQPH